MFDLIRWDNAFTGHGPRGHPLSALREELSAQRLPDAAGARPGRAKSRGFH